ncbi:hypothetical protein [Massilia sp. 9096]|uniref:hypothetical protein n=1 Tax=Massilia sp. 9096 TaxID=1500894 RepID=UPI000B07F8F5|nr:hypothetical protein [Massilia sp. 9096]
MKRILFNKASFILAAVAVFLFGMLRDPDMANADDLDTQPVAQDRMPGYQCLHDAEQSSRLTEADIRKLNPPAEEWVATF